MIKIENVEVYGWEAAIRGMRNPLNSWDKSDSKVVEMIYRPDTPRLNYDGSVHDVIKEHREFKKVAIPQSFEVGENDLELMHKLVAAGGDHRKFMRMINVTMDITAPTFWWCEFDTYKISTVRNSCSKMHTIHIRPFRLEDFTHEGCEAVPYAMVALESTVAACEKLRKDYNETQDKDYWRALIELLPEGYKLRATVQLNYEVLRNMYHSRRSHRLLEWPVFCKRVAALPHSELITGGNK